MRSEAEAMKKILLHHHRTVCNTTRLPEHQDCLISYGSLCERAGHSNLTRSCGSYLKEIAEWCRESNYPPINALVVNKLTGVPGENYDLAPGCSFENWREELDACIRFRDYPYLN